MFTIIKRSGDKLYVGGEKYEKENVIVLLLHLNGKLISGCTKKT